ncbi:hypothetical protein ACLB2K_059582 [Fragaria x ananassa]
MRPSCISSETVQDQNSYGTPFLAQVPSQILFLLIGIVDLLFNFIARPALRTILSGAIYLFLCAGLFGNGEIRSSNSGKIGAGGVLRDHLGSWVDGFQINLGTGEILDAETWGLFFGLKLVFKHSIVNIEIESDSAVLV